jgi:hypothetical protein
VAASEKTLEDHDEFVARIFLVNHPIPIGVSVCQIVLTPFLVIAQDPIGFVDLLQTLFAFRIVPIPIRM